MGVFENIDSFELVAQLIGICAMVMNILSFQQRSRLAIIAFQLVSTGLFSINYFMLGATVGGALNVVGMIRSIIFINDKKVNAKHIGWIFGFAGAYVAAYILTFTVFGKEPTPVNLVLELLPVVAMTLITVSFRSDDPKTIRIIGLINSPMWLTYNVVNMAIGAMIAEIVNAVSIILALLRFGGKGKRSESSASDGS
ncbi:MAG: YgjV family protein [Clostridia bacterium]|nr:YgjV family protein [Clostridia bacterium]